MRFHFPVIYLSPKSKSQDHPSPDGLMLRLDSLLTNLLLSIVILSFDPIAIFSQSSMLWSYLFIHLSKPQK